MRRISKVARRVIVLVLCCAVASYSQGNSWDRIRYQGGSVPSKVKPDDWNNKLTVASDSIRLDLKGGESTAIDPKRVNSLSYGQEANRRVGQMVALAVIVSPTFLLGMLSKERRHYIGLQYTTADGKMSGILLQPDKINYRAILVALQGVTNLPVAVAARDRESIPIGMAVTLSDEPTPPAATQLPALPGSIDTVTVTSVPPGAEVFTGDNPMGNTPTTLHLVKGSYTIRVVQSGFKEWTRKITVAGGYKQKLNAKLSATH